MDAIYDERVALVGDVVGKAIGGPEPGPARIKVLEVLEVLEEMQFAP
jgi:hypothetical protein